MDWKIAFFVLLGVLFSYRAFAAPVVASTPCTISIHSIKHSGERINVQFTTRLKTRAHCIALATFHRPNYESETTRFKSVSYSWNVWPKKIRQPLEIHKSPAKLKAKKFIRGYTRTLPKRKPVYLATFR